MGFYYNDEIPVNFNGFAHFYKDDYKYMPVALKIYNTYRMRAFGYWLGKQGCQVINNVRWDNPDSYKYCFDGIPQNSIVAVSTVGCLGSKVDDEFFTEGLEAMVERLNPSHILVYSFEKWRYLFDKYQTRGIPVNFYDHPATNTLVAKKTEHIYP